jgi:hypothetical protein
MFSIECQTITSFLTNKWKISFEEAERSFKGKKINKDPHEL